MNINEVEPKLAQKLGDPLREILQDLSYSFPENYQLSVSLLDANGRKKKSNAAANNWSPEAGGRLEIRFEPAVQGKKPSNSEISRTNSVSPPSSPAPASAANRYVHPAEVELLRALDRAESRPGWSFVPLKKFRDEILPLEPLPAGLRTEVEQQAIFRLAIDKRLILVGKVPNPKSPQFPVTTIRLNRLMPEVKAALGHAGHLDEDFQPVEIHGEALSSTILRERR
ncbi:MAG TPA: hypothetical protein VNW97_02075 [Candidatus Saccharimonadales bacterium]|jgi:hypothetical protein|nr:hypothetical protein [Candidatus Saccharimonadales bacterium]